MRRPGPSDDEDEDGSGCGGCCSCPIPEDENQESVLNDGFVSEAPEELTEEIAVRSEVEYVATVRFQPIMDTDDQDGHSSQAGTSAMGINAPPASPAHSIDSQTSQ